MSVPVSPCSSKIPQWYLQRLPICFLISYRQTHHHSTGVLQWWHDDVTAFLFLCTAIKPLKNLPHSDAVPRRHQTSWLQQSNSCLVCLCPSLTDYLCPSSGAIAFLCCSVTWWCHRVCRRGPAIHAAPGGREHRWRGRRAGWGRGRAPAAVPEKRGLTGGGPDWGESRPCWSMPAGKENISTTKLNTQADYTWKVLHINLTHICFLAVQQFVRWPNLILYRGQSSL